MLCRSTGTSPPPIAVLHAAETGIGGINTIIIGLGMDEISRFGAGSVHVLVPRNDVADYAGTAIVAHGFTRRSRSLRSSIAFTASLMHLVLTRRPAFVMLHSSLAGFTGRLALFCLRPIRRPVVIYCAHGWAFTMAISERRKRVFALVERAMARLTTAIVSISESEHRAALQAGLPPARLHCIPNGTPRAPDEPGDSPYPARQDRLNLLYVGRLDRQKGIDLLLAALSESPELPIHLTVVGRAVVDPVPLQQPPNITTIAWLHQRDLAPYYAHADAVVVPSRWEGYGLVAAEAFSFGTPVVASRIGGLAALVEDGVSGFLFDPTAPGALRDTLSGLDRDVLRGMRAAAHRRWADVADLEVMVRRYCELMQTLTDRRRARSAGLAGKTAEGQAKPDGLA